MSVLDNGMKDWVEKGYPTTAVVPTPKVGLTLYTNIREITWTWTFFGQNLLINRGKTQEIKIPSLLNSGL